MMLSINGARESTFQATDQTGHDIGRAEMIAKSLLESPK